MKNCGIKEKWNQFFYEELGTLLHYCAKFKGMFTVSLLCAIGSTVFTIMAPKLLSDVINIINDSIRGELDMDGMKRLMLVLLIFYGISVVLSLLQGNLIAVVTQRVSSSLRSAVIHKINSLPVSAFDRKANGDILSFITNDVDLIGQALNQSVATFITAVTLFLGSLVMMIWQNWILAASAVGATLLGFLLMVCIIRVSQKFFEKQQQLIGTLNGIVEESYAGLDTIQLNQAENKFTGQFEAVNRSIYHVAWKAQYLSGMMMPLMAFVGNLGYVAVCVVGGMMAFHGKIQFGVIIAFMLYIKTFTEPLSQISQATSNFQQAVAACKRVDAFLKQEDMPEESQCEGEKISCKGDIVFKNVTFGYTTENPLFRGLNLHIKQGEKVAVVGHTGSGKTTIASLLMRFYEVQGGDILIGDQSIKKMKRSQVHELFSFVLQETWIFEGTVMENILYGRTEIPEERVYELCKKIGIHSFIEGLPDGYETQLGEEAVLSIGQKQLITIARAVVEEKEMLILDEATSNVDTRLEMLVQEAMGKLMKGKTTIIFAHRLSTIKEADKIIVMNKGAVVEEGTHEELLAKNGYYTELYNSQFEDA